MNTYIYIIIATLLTAMGIGLKYMAEERDKALRELSSARVEIASLNAVDIVEDAVLKAQSISRNEADDYEQKIIESPVDLDGNFGDPRINFLHTDPNHLREA